MWLADRHKTMTTLASVTVITYSGRSFARLSSVRLRSRLPTGLLGGLGRGLLSLLSTSLLGSNLGRFLLSHELEECMKSIELWDTSREKKKKKKKSPWQRV